MATDTTYVIVGASLAGAKAAETLRAEGFDGRLVMIGAESERPYERPPLSKDYLHGKAERDTIYVHPAQWYAEHDVDLRLGVAATGLDSSGHKVTLADGSRVGYTKLLLATGSSPRRLTVPGAGLDGVHYLRSVQDSDRLKAAFGAASRVAVIGGGGGDRAGGGRAAAAARAGPGGRRGLREPASRQRGRPAHRRAGHRGHRRRRPGRRRAPRGRQPDLGRRDRRRGRDHAQHPARRAGGRQGR